MKRRNFLKLIGIAPIAPSVLAAKPKKPPFRAFTQEMVDKAVCHKIVGYNGTTKTISSGTPVAIPDMPRDEYGWAMISGGYVNYIYIYDLNNNGGKSGVKR